MRTIDTQNNTIVDSTDQPPIVKTYTMLDCHYGMLSSTNKLIEENARHADEVARITADKDAYQSLWDAGIDGGLPNPLLTPEEPEL